MSSICAPSFQIVTAVGCALGGAALGLLQVLSELWRDRWSFLVHRPLSRFAIFVGKVLAGLMLYGFANGVPLLAAAWWASRPGNVAAPFDWRMILQSGSRPIPVERLLSREHPAD